MRSGMLRDYMTIEAHNGLSLPSGEPSDRGWHEYAGVWGGFSDQAGNTADAGGGLESAEVTSTLRIRYEPGISPAMRVRWIDGARVRLFVIDSVINVSERRETMLLRVRELGPASNNPALATLPVAVGVE